MQNKMKVLFIGDIVGSPGRRAIQELLPPIKKKYKIDFAIANAENAAGGSGITPPIAEELFGYGLDVLTAGDHIWKKKEILDVIEADNRILRPANYPDSTPGSGFSVLKSESGQRIGVINLVGRVFMDSVDCPFRTAEKIIDEISDQTPIIIVDLHAEATSEKIAMGRFLDGRVSAVIGTHTHVQTADEQILPKGTAYLTDVGMTGPFESIIGRKIEQILTRFVTQMPQRFEMATDDVRLQAAVIEVDAKTGKAKSIERITEKLK